MKECGKSYSNLEKQMAIFKAKEFDRIDLHRELSSKDDQYKTLENELFKTKWENEQIKRDIEDKVIELERKDREMREI